MSSTLVDSGQRQEHHRLLFKEPVPSYTLDRSWTEGARTERCVDDSHIFQGSILFLPAEKDLPTGAVRRAHGKGRIEDRIHDHPVVVISQPAEESHIVHFHLITSLKGKPLDQVYDETVPAQASRRTWYLPIAPTPDHPDATSKKTKKRFPTLALANGASLKRNSWVNIRHIYKIDISLLKPYNNPETPETITYCFERQSMIRMLAKCNTLVDYEPGPQFTKPGLERSISEPVVVPADDDSINKTPIRRTRYLALDTTSTVSDRTQWDFQVAVTNVDRIVGPPPKVPPDGKNESVIIQSIHDAVDGPGAKLLNTVQSVAVLVSQRSVAISFDLVVIR